jgi:hypothetical protein
VLPACVLTIHSTTRIGAAPRPGTWVGYQDLEHSPWHNRHLIYLCGVKPHSHKPLSFPSQWLSCGYPRDTSLATSLVLGILAVYSRCILCFSSVLKYQQSLHSPTAKTPIVKWASDLGGIIKTVIGYRP